MRQVFFASLRTSIITGLLLLVGLARSSAQGSVPPDSMVVLPTDSITRIVSSLEDSLANTLTALSEPSTLIKKNRRDMAIWKPDPQRALWLALVIPGGGQIYNRKYWKLPLVYGGFMGCLYAMNWNNTMYKDYSQAYLDLMDGNPSTQSYNQFLHLGMQITEDNQQLSNRYKDIFKKRKDRFRRWRDMSFFVLVGVYALSVIDAYVDAELSVFDISKDLSLRVEPTVFGDNAKNPLKSSSLGLQCSLSF